MMRPVSFTHTLWKNLNKSIINANDFYNILRNYYYFPCSHIGPSWMTYCSLLKANLPWIWGTVSQKYYVICKTHSEGFTLRNYHVIPLRKTVGFLIVYDLFYFSWVYTVFDIRICRIWRKINHLNVSVICYDSNWVGWRVWLSKVCSVGGAGTRSGNIKSSFSFIN